MTLKEAAAGMETTKESEMSNICQHGAYADLCITCHPTDDAVVLAAIEDTLRWGIAAVDRKVREDRIVAALIAEPKPDMSFAAEAQQIRSSEARWNR